MNKRHLLRVAAYLLIMSMVITVGHASAETILPTNVETAAEGNMLVGVYGKYTGGGAEALERINQIRKEACDEGVKNPDTGRPLTSSDYVPIKWSSDLEYIARLRSCEGVVVEGHTRPNGKSCFSISSPYGKRSYGEVLAWNGSSSGSLLTAVNMWYGEKGIWVRGENGVTGHYTSMIRPSNMYVGLGGFVSQPMLEGWFFCGAGEFSSSPGVSEVISEATEPLIQTIEIKRESLGESILYEESELQSAGETGKFRLVYSLQDGSGYVTDIGSITWSSSDPGVATVDPEGTVVGVQAGYATITAMSSTGVSASRDLSILPAAPGKVHVNNVKPGKKSLTVTWDEVEGATGYVIEYQNLQSYKKAKRVTVPAGTTEKKLTGLKKKTRYSIDIYAYTTAVTGTVNGDPTTRYKKTK